MKHKERFGIVKRVDCDVVVMPGAELSTDICITGNVYMANGSNANGYDIDVGGSFFAEHAEFFNVCAGKKIQLTHSIGNDVWAEDEVVLKEPCVLGDIYCNGDVSISPNSSVWDIHAMGTVDVQVKAHAQNVTSSKMILKNVKSDAEKLQSREIEYYLLVG